MNSQYYRAVFKGVKKQDLNMKYRYSVYLEDIEYDDGRPFRGHLHLHVDKDELKLFLGVKYADVILIKAKEYDVLCRPQNTKNRKGFKFHKSLIFVREVKKLEEKEVEDFG